MFYLKYLFQINRLKAIEGIVSDAHQTRTTTIVSKELGYFEKYECSFHLSGTPVVLQVSSPIFIENGETVRLVGIHNQNGMFEALAYYNRNSDVSGSQEWSSRWILALAAGWGGFLVFIGASIGGKDLTHFWDIIPGLFGSIIVIGSLVCFERSRILMHTVEWLLNDR
jgi:hypothetical protein